MKKPIKRRQRQHGCMRNIQGQPNNLTSKMHLFSHVYCQYVCVPAFPPVFPAATLWSRLLVSLSLEAVRSCGIAEFM